MAQLQNALVPSLNFIIEHNKVDLMGYAFQIYSLFVANSTQNNEIFQALINSILQNKENWNKDMKYLIPSLGQFLISMICKYPDFMKQFAQQVLEVSLHLMNTEIRLENVALQITSALFERIGLMSDQQLHQVLFSIFSSMHFYRNNTKNKVIPIQITKAILIFFATFMINFGTDKLLNTADGIQQGIIFMIMKSEGEKVKFCNTPARDRKYVIAAFTNLLMEKHQLFLEDSFRVVVSSLIELSSKGVGAAGGVNQGNTEDMLMEGAVDQTFAFQRLTHTQLVSATTEQQDKL